MFCLPKVRQFIFSLVFLACGGIFFSQNYFWENPVRLSGIGACFPRAVSNGIDAASLWQEVDYSNSSIYLSGRFFKDGLWSDVKRFAGPFPYSGEVPDLYSAAMNSSGAVVVTVLSDAKTISVFTSFDGGTGFTEKKFSKQNLPLVAPRVYRLSDGGFIAFTSLGRGESFTMLYSRSRDGIAWNDFTEFTPAREMLNPFLPVLLSTENVDVVVFQAQFIVQSRIVYKLFATTSGNGGVSWSSPKMLDTGNESVFSSDQRPDLYSFGGLSYIAWERTPYNSDNSSVCFAELNVKDCALASRPEQVTDSGKASRPILFSHNDALCLVWFDTRGGTERVYFSRRQGIWWGEQTALSNQGRSSVFAFPMITGNGKNLSFVWQSQFGNNSSVYMLESDNTVLPPTLSALSYYAGRRSREQNVRIRVTMPRDSSGIRGYSWVWTQNPDEEVPEVLMNLPKENTLALHAVNDSEWFLKVRATDYAGNWSKPAVISYYRDTKPPLPPVINMPELDEAGFVRNNSFNIKWTDFSENEEIAGYSFLFENQGTIPRKFYTSRRHPNSNSSDSLRSELDLFIEKNPPERYKVRSPSSSIMTRGDSSVFRNKKNGVYTFSVRSFDSAGNVSEPSFITIYINKYEPFTRVDSVKKTSDVFGATTLELRGLGFAYDGTIRRITIKRQDGEEPYELNLRLADGDYKVQNDSRITGIKLDNTVPKGKYTISLFHSDRGLLTVRSAFTIEENGTVKIAREYKYTPSWNRVYDNGKFFVQTGDILFIIILFIALLTLIFAVRGLLLSIREAAVIGSEVRALFTGDIMPLEKKKQALAMRRRGTSLKLKLISFTAMIVIIVSLLVSLPLGYIMTRSQELTLTEGLQQRVNVLLSSLASGVRTYMPTQNVLELSGLPSQSQALSEANFVTITGLSSDAKTNELNFVWASNDSVLAKKTGSDNFVPGRTQISDEMMMKISGDLTALNEAAYESVGEMAKNIADLNTEGAGLALRSDRISLARSEEISVITTELTARLTKALNGISEQSTSSYPEYSRAKLDRDNTEYLFYRPVLYRQGSSKDYVRGIVFIDVSTSSLIETIDSARRTIVYTAMLVALFAVIVGTIVSWILASVIVRPIKQLAAHVVMIGNTVNKEKLSGKEIVIKSRDEIGQLGDSVNEMTRDLVKAAFDEHLAMDGKVVQRAFLPLTPDEAGNKQTVAILNDPTFQCFGYYEGASEVSGDYFDYKKLDETHYVLIKCDASGHGVPAALIMTVVATLFRKFYEVWSPKKDASLDILVTQINDFIESLGIKGKFATLILALVDTRTGDVSLCNAGDNIVHIYDSVTHKEKTLTLQETPAAGPLPTFMVEMKGGFKIEKTHLNKGDVLFLYTDGIEESTRKFRDAACNVIKCEESADVKNGEHGNHKVGSESEQMEPIRIQEIIEAVLNRKKYVLKKYHNPISNESLEFDFTKCAGTTEETILALCSVEKVFRMYKAPDVTQKDTVRADKRIDAFLKTHFNRYDFYCGSQDKELEEPAYVYYSNLREDEQLDDLTLVAARIV